MWSFSSYHYIMVGVVVKFFGIRFMTGRKQFLPNEWQLQQAWTRSLFIRNFAITLPLVHLMIVRWPHSLKINLGTFLKEGHVHSIGLHHFADGCTGPGYRMLRFKWKQKSSYRQKQPILTLKSVINLHLTMPSGSFGLYEPNSFTTSSFSKRFH